MTRIFTSFFSHFFGDFWGAAEKSEYPLARLELCHDIFLYRLFLFHFSFCLRLVFAYIYISIYYFLFVVCRESLISKCRPVILSFFFFLCCSQRIYNNNNILRDILLHTLTRSPPLFFALHSEIVSVILILLDCLYVRELIEAERARAIYQSLLMKNRATAIYFCDNENFLCILSLRHKFRFLRNPPTVELLLTVVYRAEVGIRQMLVFYLAFCFFPIFSRSAPSSRLATANTGPSMKQSSYNLSSLSDKYPRNRVR